MAIGIDELFPMCRSSGGDIMTKKITLKYIYTNILSVGDQNATEFEV